MKANIIKPDYYDKYFCIGSNCKNTCCKDWNIHLTKKEYSELKKRKLSLELGKIREVALSRERKSTSLLQYGKIKLYKDKKCPFHSKEGLCLLQLECGPEALSEVCRNFPRYHAMTGDVVEQHLSLACEEVVKFLLDKKDGIAYVSEENVEITEKLFHQDLRKEKAKKRPIYNYAFDIKMLAVATLQCRSLSLDDRILVLGIFLKHIDDLEQQKREAEIPTYVDHMLETLDSDEIKALWKNIKGNSNLQSISSASLLFDFFFHRKDQNTLEKIYRKLGITAESVLEGQAIQYNCDLEYYNRAKRHFDQFLNGRKYILENIMVTWFFTTGQPFLFQDQSIWDNYVGFAALYLLLKSVLKGLIDTDSTDEDFVQAVVNCSRNMVHNNRFIQRQIDRFKEKGTDLAQLAILIKD
ncbi:flagellin lysine-N-methylase [Anaerovorax sp. IOR16]|uniref:flagellin lysine-N-methylase n=1 Tax=Anaerovorax sp. IOR16 TaxID=2773458 RepID=UPI0019D0AC64|nr:flagellin lysine-N-methylase [Anaerovorax sp. IOR16]